MSALSVVAIARVVSTTLVFRSRIHTLVMLFLFLLASLADSDEPALLLLSSEAAYNTVSAFIQGPTRTPFDTGSTILSSPTTPTFATSSSPSFPSSLASTSHASTPRTPFPCWLRGHPPRPLRYIDQIL
ncbi:hypothetical protein Fmac_028008 [Flemingia macrophylla]|uniref:Secreted protein n=1 Tax=Flemingia macrophylla TaxID=520843 RepID=A0ABD1LJC3_9FABA